MLFWWSLTSSNLERIPGNFFANSKLLIYISFRDNKITQVGDGLLDELSNLNQVDFSGNECIDLRATGSLEVSALKEVLKSQCVDESVTTEPSTSSSTTTEITTTTSTSTTEPTTSTPNTDSPETTTKNTGRTLNFIYLNLFTVNLILYLL